MLKILLELLVRLLKISIMIICLEEPLVVMLFIRVLDMDGALLNISQLDWLTAGNLFILLQIKSDLLFSIKDCLLMLLICINVQDVYQDAWMITDFYSIVELLIIVSTGSLLPVYLQVLVNMPRNSKRIIMLALAQYWQKLSKQCRFENSINWTMAKWFVVLVTKILSIMF